jgi:sodium transport system permease protein
VDVNFLDIINIFWALMSVAIFAVALQLSVATLAKSFKDAQTLLGLLVFLPMVPIMYTLFNPGAFYDWWLWVPVLGQTSVIKEIFLGGNIAAYTFCKFWMVALLLTLPAFYLGARQLRKPKTIYG